MLAPEPLINIANKGPLALRFSVDPLTSCAFQCDYLFYSSELLKKDEISHSFQISQPFIS